MTSPTKPSSRIHTYLTLALGSGCLAGQADAATVVTFYGPGAPTPEGISVGVTLNLGAADSLQSPSSYFAYSGSAYFSRVTDMYIYNGYRTGPYSYLGSFMTGAVAGDQNYANISFNGHDGTYEAVGQFYFDALGGGYLVAIAQNDDDSALSISAGKTAIDAIPEPSSLALLALGSAGLLARRKRMAA